MRMFYIWGGGDFFPRWLLILISHLISFVGSAWTKIVGRRRKSYDQLHISAPHWLCEPMNAMLGNRQLNCRVILSPRSFTASVSFATFHYSIEANLKLKENLNDTRGVVWRVYEIWVYFIERKVYRWMVWRLVLINLNVRVAFRFYMLRQRQKSLSFLNHGEFSLCGQGGDCEIC